MEKITCYDCKLNVPSWQTLQLCLATRREEFCETPVTHHQMALINCILARYDDDEFLMTHHPLITSEFIDN